MVCLRSPLPADTGGAKDMFERLKAIRNEGVSIYLHYFTKEAEDIPQALRALCEEVHAYPRKTNWDLILKGYPYIIASRSDTKLWERLRKDDHPILFDGIHTTAFLRNIDPTARRIVVRMHNDEVRYYQQLAHFEKNPFRRFYFWWESNRLDSWMRNLPEHTALGCIQEKEMALHKKCYPQVDPFLLPPVIPQTVESSVGTGGYCLYHANLSILENEKAAIWLLKRVFAKIKLPLVIAGKSPSSKLEQLVHFYQHACLVANPSTEEMQDLIRKAQMNVLPSRTRTGIKLKIFDALQYGRHCIINTEMNDSSPWTDSCVIAADATEMAAQIKTLFKMPYTSEMSAQRAERLAYWRSKLDPVAELIKRLW